MFICLNVFAYLSCKGNSLLTLTFPVELRWLRQNRRSASKSSSVSVCGDGRDRSPALKHWWLISRKNTESHFYQHTRRSTPSLTLSWINIYISQVCYQQKGSCLSDQTEPEEQRKQEREKAPPHHHHNHQHHPSFSLLLRRLPGQSEVSSLIILISLEQVKNLPMGYDYFMTIIQTRDTWRMERNASISKQECCISITASRLKTNLFALILVK